MKNSVDKKLPLTIIYVLFCVIGNIVLSVLCLHATNNSFIRANAKWLSIVASLVLITLFFISVWSAYREKRILFKSIITVFVGTLFCLGVLFALQKSGFFNVVKDKESFSNYLQKAGAWMPTVYIVLQYLQVVILPIPGVVSTAVGVALFGPFLTILYSLIGILLGSFTAFYIGRKLGGKAVAWLIGDETLSAWQKKLKGKDNFVLTLMFLLPMFPDDILCFIAGLSTMTIRYFIIMITVSRVFAVTATCYSFQFIPFNTWWGILLWGILFAGIIIAFVLIYKNMDVIQKKLSKRKRKKKNI